MAVGAASASGQHATMWLTESGGSWKVMNIISGSDEAAYPARANGGTVFTEPQIHAWYRLKDGRVTALNDTARTSVGKSACRWRRISGSSTPGMPTSSPAPPTSGPGSSADTRPRPV